MEGNPPIRYNPSAGYPLPGYPHLVTGWGYPVDVPYTDEQKAEAVRLYVEVGPDEAARIVGCGRMSIYRWLGGTSIPDEKRETERLATIARHHAKRTALREALLDAAMAGATAIDTADPKGFQSLSIGVGTFLDKYRLEMGESTGRTETLALTADLLVSEIRRLESELGKPTPVDA